MNPPLDAWADLLPQDSPAAELELFYAHLTLGTLVGTEDDFVQHLAETLPLAEATRAHLRRQDPARLMIYRELTRATHRRVLLAAIPRAAARMAASLDRLFDDFLAVRATRSHRLRDVTGDFLAYLNEMNHGLPPYILELAELEATRIVVAAAPDSNTEISFELDLERGLHFSEATRVLSFSHAVHRLSDNPDDRELPARSPTRLLSYRSEENEVRVLELSPLAAMVLSNLMAGSALGAAINDACTSSGQLLTDEVLAGTASLLADLAARRVILGATLGQNAAIDADYKSPT